MTRPRWRHPVRGETQPRREASGPVSGPDHTGPIAQERPAPTPEGRCGAFARELLGLAGCLGVLSVFFVVGDGDEEVCDGGACADSPDCPSGACEECGGAGQG